MTGASGPELTEPPFLLVAVVSEEVLRAQEEWEVVDTIHPDIGKCGNNRYCPPRLPAEATPASAPVTGIRR